MRRSGHADRATLAPLPKNAAHRRCTANLVPDAHLAALAVEHNCTLASADADFARFRGLKWINPLVT
ncbi:MAG: PIN domain-containing protein [Chthoniobacterales bacterium]